MILIEIGGNVGDLCEGEHLEMDFVVDLLQFIPIILHTLLEAFLLDLDHDAFQIAFNILLHHAHLPPLLLEVLRGQAVQRLVVLLHIEQLPHRLVALVLD